MNYNQEELENEIKNLRIAVNWYKRTYEDRSLAGLLKEKLKKMLRPAPPTEKKERDGTASLLVNDNQTIITNESQDNLLKQKGLSILDLVRSEQKNNSIVIRHPDNCKGFIRVNIEVAFFVERGIFLCGWMADQFNHLIDFYLIEDGVRSKNLLPELTRHARRDVRDCFLNDGIDLPIESGFSIFHNSPVSTEPRKGPVQIHLITKNNELIVLEINQTHLGNSFHQQLRVLLSAVPINSDATFDILDKNIGPTISFLAENRFRPELKRIEHDFGTPPDEPEVSVIIPLYGRFDFIRHQISHFSLDNSMRDAEIIYVVDDPDNYENIVMLAKQIYPVYLFPFKVVFSGYNLGYAGANNFGVGFARAKHLLLLNSDVIPKEKGWLASLKSEADSLKNAGAIGPKLLFEDESIQHAGMEFEQLPFLKNFWLNTHPGKGIPDWLIPDSRTQRINSVTGACVLIQKKIYLEVGGFDEGYILGDFEDSDLCLKLIEKGYTNYYVPGVQLYHLERKSQSLFSDTGWKFKVTLYNGWRHTKRWSPLINKLKLSKYHLNTPQIH